MAQKHSPQPSTQSDTIILDAMGSDAKALEDSVGPAGQVLVSALDRAVRVQSSLIINYVNRLRTKHPDESPDEIQERMNKHFMRWATGSGAGVGATAAVPGIGLLAASAAVAAESVLFLDAAAFFTMASAYMRGADITDPERRRTFILVTILGAKGTAIVDAFAGDFTTAEAAARANTTQILNRFSTPRLNSINNRLLRSAVNRLGRRLTRGWIAKIMPLGIGAVAGTITNRRLASALIHNVNVSLGAPPASFPIPIAALPEVPEEQAEHIDEIDEAIEADESSTSEDSPRKKRWLPRKPRLPKKE